MQEKIGNMLTKKIFDRLVEEATIVDLFQYVYFDINKPQYHNIKFTTNSVKLYRDERWQTMMGINQVENIIKIVKNHVFIFPLKGIYRRLMESGEIQSKMIEKLCCIESAEYDEKEELAIALIKLTYKRL